MAGLEFSIVDVGGRQVKRRLDRLSHIDTTDLLESVGAVVESQIRRRIKHEKKSPDGEAWEELSPRYAKRKKKVSSGGLLELHGGLLDSIQFEVRGDTLVEGSNLIYSWTHQIGDESRGIPDRPYLGLSPEDGDEIEETVIDWLKEMTGFSR